MPRSSTILLAAAIILLAHPTAGLLAPRTSGAPRSATRNIDYSRRRHHRRREIRTSLSLRAKGDDGDGMERFEGGGGSSVEDATTASTAPQQPLEPQREVVVSGRNAISDDQSLARAISLMGTNPRRIVLSLSSSTAIALAANFFGVTSNLLAVLPEDLVEKSGLDTYYPRGGYKRVVVRGGGGGMGPSGGGGAKCSFLIPKEWVADTGLALAQARRRAVPLDYSMSSQPSSGVLPDAAYGPPGRLDDRGLSNGDTNVSVIVNTDVKDFSLASLGSGPTEAAEVLLSKRRRPTKLESAVEQKRGDNNVPVYQFEYTVDRGDKAKPLRAISVVAGSARGDAFVTLTVVSVEEAWGDPLAAARLRKVAESFKLV